ncbi:MAG: ribonuclease J [Clostridiales bacterium]|nr:ribonuclease J [Candidatus Crickella merdequi]
MSNYNRKPKNSGVKRGKSSYYFTDNESFKIIPLGGMKEIGKNCTVIECRNEILIIDCGFCFPDDEMFGIDVVIPDFSYLRENAEKIKGLIVTHGHEDHIGGIPYLLKEFNIPIYAAPLSMGLIGGKLGEHGLTAETHIIEAGQIFNVGNFKIEAIQINHSIADAMAFSVKCAGGHIVHTGDFKIDYYPLDGKVIDLNRFSQLGSEGVDVLISDSTNVLREGYTPSERIVADSINKIFDSTNQRIIIATFASNIHRIKYFMEAAVNHGRRIAISGRSMENVVALANDLGYLKGIPESAFVDIKSINNIPDSNLTIITTGSQGEPMSALTRMANDSHRAVKLKKDDVVVFSSSPIPGNEKTVTNVVNKLYEKHVDVVLSDTMDVHVSGHACREELRLIHTLIRPRVFIPAHGEYRHLIEHARLAKSLGMSKKNIFVISNGDLIEYRNGKAQVTTEFTSGEDVMVDGYGVGDIGSAVLKDRKQLSQSGLIIIAVAIDEATGSLIAEPELTTRGFIYVKDNMDLIDEATAVVYNTIGEWLERGKKDFPALRNALKDDMRSYIYKRTKRNPMILPTILRV